MLLFISLLCVTLGAGFSIFIV